MSFLDTKLVLSSAYHPETDGQTERMNQTLQVMIRHYITPDLMTWDQYLERLEMAYNISKHASTGFTPFFLNHGRNASSLLDVMSKIPKQGSNVDAQDWISSLSLDWKLAHDAISAAQQFQSIFANRKIQMTSYDVGQYVLLSVKFLKTHFRARPRHKFQKPYVGPFKVLEKLHDYSYRLDLPPTMNIHNVFYGGLLKPYIGKAKPREAESQDQMYFVKAILKSRVRRKVKYYLVQWEGYDESSNTWEPEDSLRQYVPELVDQFNWRSADEQAKRRRRQQPRRH